MGMHQMLGPSFGAAGDYEIKRSLRFNSSDSSYLNRTPSSAGNRKTWTWSGWVKRSKLGAIQYFFGSVPSGSAFCQFGFNSDDTLRVQFRDSSANANSTTNAVFRDVSAWYHIVFYLDTTQSTASNRMKTWVNGVEQTFSTDARSSITYNGNYEINNTSQHVISSQRPYDTAGHLDGYLADVQLVDGTRLSASDFGEYNDDNVWQPKKYSGAYGTNGFHLKFADNSSNAALGTDSSGNSNTWTVNNLTAREEAWSNYLTTTGTFASGQGPEKSFDNSLSGADVPALDGGQTLTWAPPGGLAYSSKVEIYVGAIGGFTYSFNGATAVTATTNAWNTVDTGSGTINTLVFDRGINETHGPHAIRVDNVVLVDGNPRNTDSLIDTPSNYEANSGNNGGNYCVWNPLSSNGGVTITNGNLDTVNTGSSYDNPRATFGMSSGKWYWEVKITSFAGGFHVGLALPTAANSSYLGATSGTWAYGDSGYKYDQGTSSNYGASFTSAGKVISCAFDADAGTVVFYNDGVSQGTAFTGLTNGPYLPALYARVNSTGGSWNFGQRPFIYTPPSGHKALCTTNLPDPTIADGSNYFKAKLYTGVEAANTNITGFNFSPDFVWLKRRDADVGHFLYDTIRGIRRSLYSNSSEAENNYSATLEAFNSDGFTLGDSGFINSNNANYVSYAWEGASSTASNTDGNITSSVRANTSAGFSIVTWSGNSQNATVGHGLGAAPEMIWHKRRNQPAGSWIVYHKNVGNNKFLQFNAADGENQGSYFDNKSPTSTIFNVSDFEEINRTGGNYVAYCFAPVAGYSAFGSYSGNNNANGPYIYTGFRPAWLLIKRKNGSANWFLVDSARDTDNTVALYLKPNTNSAEIDTNTEGTKNYIDFLSNGFKLRGTEISTNASQDYIYAAFAEHPFKTARAR